MAERDSIRAVVDWLVAGAPPAKLPQDVLQFLGDRLAAEGINIDRAGVFVTTLHPHILGRSFVWRRGKQVVVGQADISIEGTEEWRNSPVIEVATRGQPIRAHLSSPMEREYPVYKELRAEGMTDYFAQPIEFINGERHVISWATKRKGGFTADDIAAFEAVRNPVARIAEVFALRRTATNLLNTYVGHEAGTRILSGHIRRGDTESINAAIWLADLRGFTQYADTMPGTEVVALLNDFFDCLVTSIHNHDGEVLNFMGDGLLAIFRITAEHGEAHVSNEAMAAAREARVRVAELNKTRTTKGEPVLHWGLALHLGEVLYGNIGGAARLDFTTIGPAVNMAARLEALSKRLSRTVVLSSAVARHCNATVVPLGRHELRGFRDAEEAFGLIDEEVADARA
jgi:adenylate cyclase